MEKAVAKYTLLEKVADCLVAAGLLLFWIVVYVFNQGTTLRVPTHFNIQGEADAFGSSDHLYLLAALNTLLITGLYVLKAKKMSLNFGIEITESNKSAIRVVMNQTLSLFAVSLLIIFGIILMETVTYNEGDPAYSFILIFLAIKIPVVFYLAKTQDVS